MFKYLAGMSFALVLFLCGSASGRLALIPVDVVMSGDEVSFVLEKPYEIKFVRVSAVSEKGKPLRGKLAVKPLWLLGYDPAVKIKERKYVKLKEIKYGEKYPQFPWVEGPAKLRRNVKYLVEINIAGKIAGEIFFITDDNKVVVPNPSFKRRKSLNAVVDKDGK